MLSCQSRLVPSTVECPSAVGLVSTYRMTANSRVTAAVWFVHFLSPMLVLYN